MHKAVKLQRAMTVNRTFSYALLERLTGLSTSFVYNKIKKYEAEGFIVRAGMDHQKKLWRLTQEGKRQFDPHASKAPVLMDVAGARPSPADHRQEKRLWIAILELKRFRVEDLLELNLAKATTTKQYVALLRRAGLLTGTRPPTAEIKSGAPMVYTVSDDAGELAPLMGRCFYLFDPNTREYFSTPMADFDEKKRPGDVSAS